MKRILRKWSDRRPDFIAGAVVALISIPLSLGIALASDVPLSAALLAAIIGGVLVGKLSGSEVAVAGPAAGLALLVAQSIHQLGSFEALLAAVFLAGVLQFILGLLRAGALANIFPTSVMKGLLAAIGLNLILKQIPHVLGVGGTFEGTLVESAGAQLTLYREIRAALHTPNGSTLFIFLLSTGTIALWSTRPIRGRLWLRLTPPAIAALLVGTTANELTNLIAPHAGIPLGSEQLVNLPLIRSWPDFSQLFRSPDWNALHRPETFRIALTLALVASIETLLCLEAGDKLDRYFRLSSKNRELMAQGVGNCIAGLIGALPITTVVVRTTTNIFSGARTRNSAIWNGFFVLVATLSGAFLLNHIPLACISAILVSIAYRLIKPEIFQSAWQKGPNQFVPLLVTTLAIVATDILIGSAIGLVAGVGMSLWTNYYSGITVIHEGQNWLIRFSKDVSFINKIRIKTTLQHIPDGASVLIDGTKAMFIDLDVIEELEEFRQHCEYRKISLEMKGIEGKEYPFWSLQRKLRDLA